MPVIFAVPLPDHALLNACRSDGGYTDCYATDVEGVVLHEQFVYAFYTTMPFKMERAILKWTVAKPSTDADVAQLASGAADTFAAWRVEKRCPDQLLLTDFQSRTKSWLMVTPITTAAGPGTRLYFGSAVVPSRDRKTGEAKLGTVFRALLGFHKLYSVILLRAARSRVMALRAG